MGAAMKVHGILGCGFNEQVYQDALELELGLRGIPFAREKHLPVYYKGFKLKHDYYADFVCFDKIIVECKAVSSVIDTHIAQVLNYMHISRFPVGILMNFGEPSLYFRSYVMSEYL